MITCTQCGEKNDDAARFCARCGKKLQSSLCPASGSTLDDRPKDPLTHMEDSGGTGFAPGRSIEAWVYVLLVTGAALVCAWRDVWWPLYPVAAAVGLAVWLRKI